MRRTRKHRINENHRYQDLKKSWNCKRRFLNRGGVRPRCRNADYSTICRGFPMLIPAWVAPLNELYCRLMTDWPAFSCSSENSRTFLSLFFGQNPSGPEYPGFACAYEIRIHVWGNGGKPSPVKERQNKKRKNTKYILKSCSKKSVRKSNFCG